MKVIAIERLENVEPALAILIDERHPDTAYWWSGGYTFETLSISPKELNLSAGYFKPVEIYLPHDWQKGYLAISNGKAEFRYGTPPKRETLFS